MRRGGEPAAGAPASRAASARTLPLRRIWGPSWPRLLLGDALVLCLLGAGIVAASIHRPAGGSRPGAEVVVSGQKVLTLDLSREGVHEVLGAIGVTRVEIAGGRVRVLSSPCPRQVCRHDGWIAKAGEVIVCLPNEVVIRVPGEPGDGTDAVVR